VIRKRFTFRGTVQGVGFRPSVFRLAVSLRLSGFVQNRRSEVVVEVQGDADRVSRFAAEIAAAMPPAARIEAMAEAAAHPLIDETAFLIIESGQDSFAFPPIPPDLPLCAECARELLSPGNRRYLYPFITCTQCGPRYSIVERTPFDRVNTTMQPFTQCPSCAAEYADPSDRRFHSQTNSCAACGPSLACFDGKGNRMAGDPLKSAIAALGQGKVVAVHGIGGFHLAADPRAPRAVEKLRHDKEREHKPFALMVRDLEEARALCVLSKKEEQLLASAEAPIVIALRRSGTEPWTLHVSDTDTLGVMLPYTPLHLLLFAHPGLDIPWRALVMTSGNRADEPIITDPAEARRKLAGTADVFLCHDRRIAFRTDDSVVRTGAGSAPYLLRRSRGHVPRLITLPRDVRGVVLALGGDLKNAPALARGSALHLCAYNGDLESSENLAQFSAQVRQVLDLYGVVPDVVVHDLHPLYHSSRWSSPPGARRSAVQHHFGHALSVMAEHGLEESLALSFDGTGYGIDGSIWGGEFLHATRGGFTRLGSFAPFPLPGGDAAVLHPPRTAFALLGESASGRIPGLNPSDESFLRAMLLAGVNCPVTTSLGRVFDAAAAILGLVDHTSYEGEGPIRLEGKGLRAYRGAAAREEKQDLPALVPVLPGTADGRLFLLDPRPLLAALLKDGTEERIPALSLLFHEAIALACVEGARRMRRHTGLPVLALSGGVFQNLLLRELLVPLLIKEGFEVFLNVQAPPGDGGLAVGQAWFEI
jgi:hydrogenase maturation protein HypF